MNWLFLSIVNIFIYSTGSLLNRIYFIKNKVNPISFSVIYTLLLALIFLFINILFPPVSQIPYSKVWINLVIMAVLYGFGNLFCFKALQMLEVSRFTLITALRVAISTIGFIVVLKQPFSMNYIYGIVLILVGVVLANRKGLKVGIGKGEVYALLCALFFGMEAVNDKYLLANMALNQYVFLSNLLPAAFIGLIMFKEVKDIKGLFTRKSIPYFVGIVIIFCFASLTYFGALQLSPSSSLVAILSLITIPLTVFLGVIFLKEREDWILKFLGAAISFAGLFLLV